MGLAGLELFRYFLADRLPLAYNQLPYGNCSERTIEIPLALRFLAETGAGAAEPFLEIGNVLANYKSLVDEQPLLSNRLVLDKFEEAPGVMNVDLMEYGDKFSLILCLSTVEHIGQHAYGEKKSGDREAPLAAIRHVYNLLKPGGEAFLTVPFGKLMDMGWLIQFDDAYLRLLNECYGVPAEAVETSYFRKLDMDMHLNTPRQHWVQCEKEELAETMFDSPFMFANGIAVLRLTKIGADVTTPPSPHRELVFLSAPVVSNVYFTPFVRPGGFDKDGYFPARRAGYVFYGHSVELPPGSYELRAEFELEGSGEFVLELISEKGLRPLWSMPVAKSGTVRANFLFDREERFAEFRLYKRNAAPCRVKVPSFVLLEA